MSNVTIVGPKGEIKTSVLNELNVKSINSQAFIGAFTPLTAAAIAPQIQLIVQSCIQPLIISVKEQQKDFEEQNEEIETLKKSNAELQQRVDDLEYGLDNIEQRKYGIRCNQHLCKNGSHNNIGRYRPVPPNRSTKQK